MRMMKAKSNPQEVKSPLKQKVPGFVDYLSWVVVATQIFFLFTPKIGEDEPILTNIFQRGLGSTTN